MVMTPLNSQDGVLPESFRPILWSYNFSKIDPEKDMKTIVIQAINYGNLKHWNWIMNRYGLSSIQDILTSIVATEIHPRTRKLVSIMFSIEKFNYAPRGTH